MRTDVVVLGAGIVGVSVAVHLQKRGRAVLLVDRQAPGEGTSFGNTGLIQREAVYPYGFPRRWSEILRHGLNRSIDSHYHWGSLPKLAPFLARYWWHSGTERHAEIARKYAPLIERCVPEHLALAGEADATGLLRPGGWIKLFRTPAAMDERVRDAEKWAREFGIEYAVLDPRALAEKEPHLDPTLIGALHFPEPVGVKDPHALTLAYAGLLEKLGGSLARGDAASLEPAGDGWRVATDKGRGRGARGRGRARRLGRRGHGAARLSPAARRQARLSHALQAGRQCRPEPHRPRRRDRLCHGADGARHPPDHRRRVCRPRRAEDAGPARAGGAALRDSCSRSASGSIRSPGWGCARARPTCCR